MWSAGQSVAGGGEMKRHPDALISRTNYKDTRAYITYCAEVMHAAPGSLRLYRTALDHLLKWATDRPFAQAETLRPVFPRYIADLAARTVTYQSKLIETVRNFFSWSMERYPDRYPARAWLATLRLVQDQAPSVKTRELYTLAEVLTLIRTPATTLTEQRNQAAVAFLFLSGMRAAAFVTLPLGAVNWQKFEVHQWPSLGVKTKNRKAGTTFLLQNHEVQPLITVAQAWQATAQRELGDAGMWYSLIQSDGATFAPEQLPGASRIQNLAHHLETLCLRAGVPYKSPHKFRHGFAVYALSLCKNMEDFKAVSQNLMHQTMSTTDEIYSCLLTNQVADRIANLRTTDTITANDDERIQQLAAELFRLVSR